MSPLLRNIVSESFEVSESIPADITEVLDQPLFAAGVSSKSSNILIEVENKVIQTVSDQSEDIFGKQMSVDELKPMFFSNIKESPDREPKFRVKVDSTIDDKVKPHVYDEEKKPLYDEIKNGLYSRNSGTAIVEMVSVYFLNKKFGVSWKLNSLVVYEPQRLKGFQFIGV